jgi:hypothetical protein
VRYRIDGVWKHDGSEMSKTIEADTEDSAREIASTQGILVAAVEARGDPMEELASQAGNTVVTNNVVIKPVSAHIDAFGRGLCGG